MTIRNFKDLEVWKLGKQIVLEVYRVTTTFPKEETFSLTQQMRRAAISVPSNIAEGFNRVHNKEERQFLYMALGSCAEVETQTDIAFELKYLDGSDRDRLLEQLDHESRMLRNLIKRL